jgi:hypothetical protein
MLISSAGREKTGVSCRFPSYHRFREGTDVISMRRIFSLIVVSVCIGMTAGCVTLGGGGLAGMDRRDVTDTVDRLAAAYAAGDPDGFMALVSIRYAGIYGELEKRVTKDMTDAPGVVYTIKAGGVSVDEAGRVVVEVTWERAVSGAEGAGAGASGVAVLVFDRFGSVLKLTDQQGDAPFPPGT